MNAFKLLAKIMDKLHLPKVELLRIVSLFAHKKIDVVNSPVYLTKKTDEDLTPLLNLTPPSKNTW